MLCLFCDKGSGLLQMKYSIGYSIGRKKNTYMCKQILIGTSAIPDFEESKGEENQGKKQLLV